MFHHRGDFFGLFRTVEILTHPIFEDARLTHIYDHAVFIQHDIDARIIGQKFEFFL